MIPDSMEHIYTLDVSTYSLLWYQKMPLLQSKIFKSYSYQFIPITLNFIYLRYCVCTHKQFLLYFGSCLVLTQYFWLQQFKIMSIRCYSNWWYNSKPPHTPIFYCRHQLHHLVYLDIWCLLPSNCTLEAFRYLSDNNEYIR